MAIELTNSNYCATVVKVRRLVPLDKMDRCVGVPVFGYQAIVGKDSVKEGDLGLVFTSETQLADGFLRANSLYRDKTKNVDPEKAGYFDDNGRVKAIKLKGNVSSAFFIPVSCLDYLGAGGGFEEGQCFNYYNGQEVCRKYLRKEPQARGNKVRQPKFSRVDAKLFPEHVDTENWYKNEHKIDDNETIIVTQKLHGTSARFTKQSVQRQLTWKEKIAKWLGVKVAEREYVPLVGTRRTIRDITDKNFYYEHDVWNDHMEVIGGLIPKNWVVYGEIVGWAGGSPIQSSYTYDLPVGTSRLYIYRIAVVNEDGISVDLGWEAVKKWCRDNGLLHVPELYTCAKKDFKAEALMDRKYYESGFGQCIPLAPESPCDEGVVVRVEGLRPYVLKAKSPSFLVYETGVADTGAVDLEEDAVAAQ